VVAQKCLSIAVVGDGILNRFLADPRMGVSERTRTSAWSRLRSFAGTLLSPLTSVLTARTGSTRLEMGP
jgi:hypothetical protein